MESTTDEIAQCLNEAMNWIERQRYDQAHAAIDRGLKLSPGDPDLLFAAAQCAYMLDEHERAQELTDEILTQQPEHYGARRLRAALAVEAGDYVGAEQALLALLKDYPADADLIADYGRLMLRTLHLHKAEQLAARALKEEPENRTALIVASMCDIIAGRPNADQSSLLELLKHYPNERSSLGMLINSLVSANRLTEAQRVAETLVRLDPSAADSVRVVRELRYARHWSMIPLRPLQRFGWGAVIALYVAIVFGTRALKGVIDPSILTTISVSYLIYCLYSWIWPSLLKRWMFRESAR